MKHFLSLTDFSKSDIFDIFSIADEIKQGKYKNFLQGKTVVMFFPNSSIRTRVTFEKGISQLGGQSVLFPTDTLDKREDFRDVCGYLNNWVDMIIVRHSDFSKIEELAKYSAVPVINGLSSINHPCEIVTDMYALSKLREDFTKDKYLFCGANGNIGFAWFEASKVMGFELSQCCAEGYEIEGIDHYRNILDAVVGKDIICTDSLPRKALADFANCRVTLEAMKMANKDALLNPCPPFFRGEEVSADAVDSDYFVGYEFKKSLLTVQQAVMIYCMG